MSPRAERVEFLRRQHADLKAVLDNWPEAMKHRHARRKKFRTSLDIVDDILRNLGASLIAGVPQ